MAGGTRSDGRCTRPARSGAGRRFPRLPFPRRSQLPARRLRRRRFDDVCVASLLLLSTSGRSGTLRGRTLLSVSTVFALRTSRVRTGSIARPSAPRARRAPRGGRRGLQPWPLRHEENLARVRFPPPPLIAQPSHLPDRRGERFIFRLTGLRSPATSRLGGGHVRRCLACYEPRRRGQRSPPAPHSFDPSSSATPRIQVG